METIYYVILAIVALYLIGPLFRDSSPIPETSGNVHKCTSAADFDSLLKSTTNVVVDFYADWCPPCRAIAPILSKLADKYAIKGRLAFAKVNVDHVHDVAGRYGVSAMPTFVFFEGGNPTPVMAKGVKDGASVVRTNEGLVDRIRGADPMSLTAVVVTLGEKARAAAGIKEGDDGDVAQAEKDEGQ